METVEKRLDCNAECGVEISTRERVQDLTVQFSSRGLVKSVERDTASQVAREEATRTEEPVFYRLSTLSEEEIDARYRHGKELMDGDGLMEYFKETRNARTREADFSAPAPQDDLVKSGEEQKACTVSVRGEKRMSVRERICALPRNARELPGKTVEQIRLSVPLWFNGSAADTRRETRRFPLSAFAAILAVAMCLMLVVASSVLVNHAEGRLNTLKLEVTELSGEISDMKADLSVQNDLIVLREVAVNEFGMVDEDFVRMEYVSKDQDDSIVILDEEEEQSIGLFAILNALGFR